VYVPVTAGVGVGVGVGVVVAVVVVVFLLVDDEELTGAATVMQRELEVNGVALEPHAGKGTTTEFAADALPQNTLNPIVAAANASDAILVVFILVSLTAVGVQRINLRPATGLK